MKQAVEPNAVFQMQLCKCISKLYSNQTIIIFTLLI